MSIPQTGGGVIERHDQLAGFLESGCKPPEDWRIGTEHEKFGFVRDGLTPLPYDGPCSVRAMLEGLRDGFGWSPLEENGNIIGLERDGANVSLEPGGQLELSGAQLRTIHETCDEANRHLDEVRTVADRIGAGFIGLGASPDWTHDQMPMMPKGRYRLMTDYMDRVGTHGKQMMYRTCTIQVNLDFRSESDMVKKLRVALALQPVATALFANSPIFEGRDTHHQSWRSRVWRDLDADRTGMLPFVFEDGMGFERWAEYALDVPMYFVYRDGHYVDALGQSFRDFLEGRLPALPGERPRLSDWADHLTTVFPEARVKTFIEMRGADGGPWWRICALPAFWVGLLYDGTALDAAHDLGRNWDAETREALRIAASVDGIDARVGPVSMRELAEEALDISESGLKARARPASNGLVPDESHFLNSLRDVVESGSTLASELLERFTGEYGGDPSRIYADYSY
ncbi:MAG: glutamate--cysteine ligase [Paracoccaceae bacterium]|nr:glutamate--cysteine ligase [Paracoccaceae bacterium]MDE2913519.1 glutamate--cysteine ligase [Paracoccaceae bacterium]